MVTRRKTAPVTRTKFPLLGGSTPPPASPEPDDMCAVCGVVHMQEVRRIIADVSKVAS